MGLSLNDSLAKSSYYVSSLAYYRVEQFFRSSELKVEYKKARFHLLYIVRLLAIGESLPPFNSNNIESKCEEFKNILIDEEQALTIFRVAQDIFESSKLDLDKKQYKSESETQMLLTAYRTHNDEPADR